MEPQIVTLVIGVITIIVALAGSWAVVQYRVSSIEERQKQAEVAQINMGGVLHELRLTIRTEMGTAVDAFHGLLFSDGTSTYCTRLDCERFKERCRGEIMRRIDKLEEQINTKRNGN